MTATAFAVFLISMAIILAVFTVVARSTRHSRDVDYAAANKLRLLFFVSLSAILLVVYLIAARRLFRDLLSADPELRDSLLELKEREMITDPPRLTVREMTASSAASADSLPCARSP